MSWTFEQPDALWALLLIIPMVAMFWMSRRRLSGARLAALAGLRIALMLGWVTASR